ncbi:MAG TPA: alpha/beta hydrolase [Dehalococcoidia bacterium]|jgi:acetyl esterase/lipase|nr:alpha/beta hydrolase [Dehalococcoidia bacterium]MEE2928071.1 alpha/beta hydrolase [Chloroflexota bacterium]HIB10996.1 alpha/beta hydrolase [Dehalococcoidia bacterium]HIM47680.1 alpha/beta hydrolase [Dehalococcoidia bacterium]HIO62643.1 alpha/beta hydrolase [Dehalococcoidia bacterium]|tara:strand:- start:6071 stop:6931 length:861 start_codon:yes stop_codon:yes gene_type:complete
MTTKAQTYNVDISDVEYLNHGGAPLLAKLFKPQGSGPFPIMLELHGGAWVRGGRENGDAANEALAKTGVIVAALDFRTQERYPASVADIHYAVRWAKSQAASWNGIPDSVGAMGTSSGAHQAMLLGMRPNDSRYAALPSPAGSSADGTLACVIMVSPVIDPLGRYLYAKGLRSDCTPPEGMGERTPPMHEQYWGTEEAMAEGAPARILAAGEKTELPPTLALRRSYEAAHPRPDFDEFIDQYRKAGGPIDLTIFEGEGEGLLSDLSSDVGKQTLEEMGAFIHKHIG